MTLNGSDGNCFYSLVLCGAKKRKKSNGKYAGCYRAISPSRHDGRHVPRLNNHFPPSAQQDSSRFAGMHLLHLLHLLLTITRLIGSMLSSCPQIASVSPIFSPPVSSSYLLHCSSFIVRLSSTTYSFHSSSFIDFLNVSSFRLLISPLSYPVLSNSCLKYVVLKLSNALFLLYTTHFTGLPIDVSSALTCIIYAFFSSSYSHQFPWFPSLSLSYFPISNPPCCPLTAFLSWQLHYTSSLSSSTFILLKLFYLSSCISSMFSFVLPSSHFCSRSHLSFVHFLSHPSFASSHYWHVPLYILLLSPPQIRIQGNNHKAVLNKSLTHVAFVLWATRDETEWCLWCLGSTRQHERSDLLLDDFWTNSSKTPNRCRSLFKWCEKVCCISFIHYRSSAFQIYILHQFLNLKYPLTSMCNKWFTTNCVVVFTNVLF